MGLIDRQAAIDAVRSYYDEFDTSDKSIEERIKALPSEQPNVHDTNVGDLISRQAVYEILERYNSTADVDAIRMDVEDLSSAQERKKGEWEVAIGYDPKRSVMCSECRRMAYEPTPFCPNCGAEMVNSDE